MTEPALAPIATEKQVRRLAKDWLSKARDGQVLAIKARPEWQGDDRLEVDGIALRVVPCPSPLAMRAALVDRAEGEKLIVLTDCDEDTLGIGLLAHCAKHQPISIEPWELVRSQFGVSDLDPALVREGRWLAEALIEHAPAAGWPPVTGSVLTRDHALRSLAAALLGVAADDLDSAGILQWTTRSGDVVRYMGLPAGLRAGVRDWLGQAAGPPARWAMACVDAGNGTDAIPIGLLARLLWGPDVRVSTVVTAARVRLERLIGGEQPSEADALAWAEAAQAWVERALEGADRHFVARLLGRAEEIARSVQAEPLLIRSDLLPAALTARLHGFADALRRAVARPRAAELEAVETALREVRRHGLAKTEERVTLAEMATRLLRWLATADREPPRTLAEAVSRYVTEDGWVDRARLRVWAGDPDPRVAEAYRVLHVAVDERRVAHDARFAELLAQVTAADAAPGSMLRVEDVLARVVRPLLDAGQRVLLLVVDGMSVAASTELVQSVIDQGWIELTPNGGSRVGVLAALPTVTQVSRASLFAGRITVGQQADERAALTAAFGADVKLLHKAELRAGPGASLDAEVVDSLKDPSLRLVAAVVNTIDDALYQSEPGVTEWTTQTVRAVRDLLVHAKDRVVVLVSDHGHVVDRGPETVLRADPSGGARWRTADRPAGEGELLFTGPRVALGGGRVVLPWRETLRYTARQAGYHGGASPAEAVIPLAVLSATGDQVLPGWAGAPVASPPWWRGPVTVTDTPAPAALPATPGTLFAELAPASAEATATAPTGGTAPTTRADTSRAETTRPPVTSAEPPAAASGGPAAASSGGPAIDAAAAATGAPVAPTGQLPEVVAALLGSDVYRRRHKLVGRATLPDARVAALLSVLLARRGRARLDTLAAEAGIPAHRINPTIAALRRLLQVEGYPVLDLDADGQTVLLDEQMLRDQFQLGPGR